MKYASLMIGHKIYFTNRENLVLATTIYIGYDMVVKGADYDLCELLQLQLLENIKQSKKKNCAFKFGSLIICLLFYFMKRLLGKSEDVFWNPSRPVGHQIFEHMHNLGNLNAQEDALINFFAIFKRNMNERDRILRKIVEKYKHEIIFHVSTDECMIEAIEP